MDAEDSRPVEETSRLDPAERLVLWGVRHWVACYQADESPWPLLSDIFERNGAIDAAASIDGILRLTTLSAMRSLNIRCTECPEISADEKLILAAAAHAQRREVVDASLLLQTWLPPTAVRVGYEMIRGLAQLLAQAGLVFPKRKVTLIVGDDRPREAECAASQWVH